jgi:hypothetical protein
MKRKRQHPAAGLAGIPGEVIFYALVGIASGFWNRPAAYLIALAILLIPFVMKEIARRRHLRDVANGLCPCCRYDLRATPDRCPECGMVLSRR